MPSPEIAVVGAGGLVGRQLAEALAEAGAEVTAIGRRAPELAAPAPVRARIRAVAADARDAAALGRAIAGARVVVNAAGPLRETAAPVLEAALAAGAHYVDIGGEQAVLVEVYERYESAVRRAGLAALPGAGVDCLLGDLAAAWAAAHLIGAGDAADPAAAAARAAPGPRLAEARPLDEVAVTYVLDELSASAGLQRAWFGAVGGRALAWHRDRWEPARPGEGRRVNAGPALGGERAAVAHAGGDAITIPRHIAAARVATYASATRREAAMSALRLLSRALPFVPRTAADLLVPYADPSADHARTRFAVVAQVRRDFEAVQIAVRGQDLYRTTARIAAWAALHLAARGAGPVGVCAPGELFRGAAALRELAASAAAGLAIEPSFGCGINDR